MVSCTSLIRFVLFLLTRIFILFFTAINLDKVDVRGINIWSLAGQQYGLYNIDSNGKRTAKSSAAFYRNLIVDNAFQQYSDVMTNTDEFLYGNFPKDFIWSSATASYQIEGGWNEGGKYSIISLQD